MGWIGSTVSARNPIQLWGCSRGTKVRFLNRSDFGSLIAAAGDSACEQRVQASARSRAAFSRIAGCVAACHCKLGRPSAVENVLNLFPGPPDLPSG